MRFFGSALALLLTAVALAQNPPQPAPTTPVPLADPAAYIAREFGPDFKYDPRVAPMVGDLDGDGRQDLVLVARAKKPLAGREKYHYEVDDPYDSYFGNGDVRQTSQFTLHFDGSERQLLIVFAWRDAETQRKLHPAKCVLINTPFDRAQFLTIRLQRKPQGAISLVEHSTLHTIVFLKGHKWHWQAQGMAGDEDLNTIATPHAEDDDAILPPRN